MKIKQPELGKQLTLLRHNKNMTQQDLVDACNISIRTIQRIESGESTPRASTVRIILSALQEDFSSFDQSINAETGSSQDWLQAAWIASIVNLVFGMASSIMVYRFYILKDIKLTNPAEDFLSSLYVSLTISIAIAGTLFLYGYVKLAGIFQANCLKWSAWIMITLSNLMFATEIILIFLAIDSEIIQRIFFVPFHYASIASGLFFATTLIQLRDGMGKIILVAILFELVIAFCLIRPSFFFLVQILTVPCNLLHTLILYRGYEMVRKESLGKI